MDFDLTSLNNEQHQLLAQIALHLAQAESADEALAQVIEWLDTLCDLRRGVISLIDEVDHELKAEITASSVSPIAGRRMRYRPGEGITGQVFATGKALFVPDLSKDERFLNRSGMRRETTHEGAVSFFCVPVLYHATVLGTMGGDKQAALIADPDMELSFLQMVAALIAPFVRRKQLENQMLAYRRARQPGGAFTRLTGRSTKLLDVERLITTVAHANTLVLITGETGTGKSVAAEALHMLSPRSKQPFIEINCGAIPENLIESELFGHERGAFTGAIQRHLGVFERAGEGTVFLDEVGELPLPAQTRLLRVLQKGEFERVGGTETIHIKARIIAATNRNLRDAVDQGIFRADLFYRLHVFPIQMPSLRERGAADITLLADMFAQKFALSMGKTITRISKSATEMLTSYNWPGNIRELENAIERSVVLSEDGIIHGWHLPATLQGAVARPHTPRSEDSFIDFDKMVKNLEVDLINEAMTATRGNQTLAAERLGITKRIIQYKIAQYGIDWRAFRKHTRTRKDEQ
ncbi:sigma 54-interacting transcriptional regulator [Candidatus Sumerlaeota bacterium]|nr:sigma 54-interacting transcriptional regulator [Candidatus Sumerlaeota bacterium]